MAARRSNNPQWFQAQLAPVVLIKSKEPLLAERAVTMLRNQAKERDASVDIHRVDAASYNAGDLAIYASPSLFGEARFIYFSQVELGTPAFFEDAAKYVENPEPDAVVVLRHNGGNAGQKLLRACTKAKVPTYHAEEVKSPREKANLVQEDVRRARRRIEPAAVEALVDALGSDLAELAAMTSQLLQDVEGTITEKHVHRYQAGRVEASAFAVADAAIAGNTGRALTLLRHALATGAAPAALVGAIAMKIRQMAKVSIRPALSAKELGMQGWQLDRARRDLRGWNESRLRRSVLALAEADEAVKGGSREPEYALEKLVITISGGK